MKSLYFYSIFLYVIPFFAQINTPATDFLFQPDQNVHETSEDLQNFHKPAIIHDEIKFPNHREFEDISMFVVARDVENDILKINAKNFNLTKNELNSFDTIPLKSNRNASIFAYTESVPFNPSNFKEDGVFEFNPEQIYYEAIAINSSISDKKRLITESYLAMKYGITLNKSYVNSMFDTIWNYEQNKKHTNNIICVGRDDKTGLNQKQAINQDNSFSFGLGQITELNSQNPYDLTNKNYIFISDNNAVGEESHNGKVISQREWKVNKKMTEKENNLFSFHFNHKKFIKDELGENETFWLVIDDSNEEKINPFKSKYISVSSIDKDNALFSSIDINQFEDEFKFTLMKTSQLFLLSENSSIDCRENNTFKIKAIGSVGKTKFVLYRNDQVIKHYESPDGVFEINDRLLNGEYFIAAQDEIGNETVLNISLPRYKALERNHQVNHIFYEPNSSTLIFAHDYIPEGISEYFWLVGNTMKKSDKLYLDRNQEFALTYFNLNGCQETVEFLSQSKKPESQNSNTVNLYPNPAQSSQPFTLQFSLAKPSDVQMKIISSSGQMIYQEEGYKIWNSEIEFILNETGEYFIVIEIENEKQSFKLLVK